MAAKTAQIAWGDGTSDKITVSYIGESGNEIITISSQLNYSGVIRSKDVHFKSPDGDTLATLTVKQETMEGKLLTSVGGVLFVTEDGSAVGLT